MTQLVDRAIYRLAPLWWTAIYRGLCRHDVGKTTRGLTSEASTAHPQRQTFAA
jgi:hypothetical protein